MAKKNLIPQLLPTLTVAAFSEASRCQANPNSSCEQLEQLLHSVVCIAISTERARMTHTTQKSAARGTTGTHTNPPKHDLRRSPRLTPPRVHSSSTPITKHNRRTIGSLSVPTPVALRRSVATGTRSHDVAVVRKRGVLVVAPGHDDECPENLQPFLRQRPREQPRKLDRALEPGGERRIETGGSVIQGHPESWALLCKRDKARGGLTNKVFVTSSKSLTGACTTYRRRRNLALAHEPTSNDRD